MKVFQCASQNFIIICSQLDKRDTPKLVVAILQPFSLSHFKAGNSVRWTYTKPNSAHLGEN